MPRVKAVNMDDLELPNYDSDGESSVDNRETTPQLDPPDGESSVEVGDYEGADRVLESVQGNIPEFKEAPVSKPVEEEDTPNKSKGGRPRKTVEPEKPADKPAGAPSTGTNTGTTA